MRANMAARTGAIVLIMVASCLLTLCFAADGQQSKFRLFWPPVLNSYYPDVEMQTLSGAKVKLSQYAGKTLLIEPIGMSCPACQAFAGGQGRGGFNGVSPQAGLSSIDTLLSSSGVSAQDPRLVRIQLLLYGPTLQAPTLKEAQAWAQHFAFGRRSNEVVLVADGRFQNNASYNMIPGFQVVDKDFVMRSNATGHQPQNDLYKHLLPTLKSLLK